MSSTLVQAEVELRVIAASIPSRVLEPRSVGLVQPACTQSSSVPSKAAGASAARAHCTGDVAHGDTKHSTCTDSLNGQTTSAEFSSSSAPQHPTQTPCWGRPEGLPAAQGLSSSSSSLPQRLAQRAAFQDQAEGLPDAEVQGMRRHMEVAGLQWELPEGVEMEDCILLWLGEVDTPAMTQLMLKYSG